MYFLGIDGGGTKTTGAVVDVSGRIVAYDTVGATNHNGTGIERTAKELKALLVSLKTQDEQAFSKVGTVFAGMAGAGRPDAQKAFEDTVKEIVPANVSIIIDHDGINALLSGTKGEPGIVQIAGTGSITFGMNSKNERARAGGWGYLIDDEGSGYAIGRDALHAVFQEFDGRGGKTLLTGLILEHFKVAEPPDLIRVIYEPGKSKEVIAPLGKVTAEAAASGDAIAGRIVSDHARSMGLSIRSLIAKLFNEEAEGGKEIPVVLAGGMFRRAELFIPTIDRVLKEAGYSVKLIRPEWPPVAGAVIAAVKNEELGINDDFVTNLSSGFQKMMK